MNRTHKYVKVYVSEKGTLIYIFNSPNRDGIFFEREAERRVIQLDIASRAERWKRVVIEYPRVCEKTMGAWGWVRGGGGGERAGINRVKSSLKLIIKIKRLAKLVIYYFRRPIRGTSLGILRLNIKRGEKRRGKKRNIKKRNRGKFPCERHARVWIKRFLNIIVRFHAFSPKKAIRKQKWKKKIGRKKTRRQSFSFRDSVVNSFRAHRIVGTVFVMLLAVSR